jgi:hypothetical protein
MRDGDDRILYIGTAFRGTPECETHERRINHGTDAL